MNEMDETILIEDLGMARPHASMLLVPMVSFLFNPKLRDGSLSSSYLFAARWAALYCLDYQSDWWKRARKMSLSMAEIIRKKP